MPQAGARNSRAPPCPSASWQDPQGSGACLQPQLRPVQNPLPPLQALATTAAAAPPSPAPTAIGPWPEESGSESSSHQGVWDGYLDEGSLTNETFALDHAGEVPSQAEPSQGLHLLHEQQQQQQHGALHHQLHHQPNPGQELHPSPHSSMPLYQPPSTEQHNLQGSTEAHFVRASTSHSGTSMISLGSSQESSTNRSVSCSAPAAAPQVEPAPLPVPEGHTQRESLQQQQQQQQRLSSSSTAAAAVQTPRTHQQVHWEPPAPVPQQPVSAAPTTHLQGHWEPPAHMPQCSDPNQQPMEALVTRFVGHHGGWRPSAAVAGDQLCSSVAEEALTPPPAPSGAEVSPPPAAAPPPSATTASAASLPSRKAAVKSSPVTQAKRASTKPAAAAASTLQQQSPAEVKTEAESPASPGEASFSSRTQAPSHPQQRPSKPKQPRKTLPTSSAPAKTQHKSPRGSRTGAKARTTKAEALEEVLKRHALPPLVAEGLLAAVEGGSVAKYITPKQVDKLLHRVLDAGEDLGVSMDTLHTVLRRHPNVLLKQSLTVLRAKAAALKELLGCADESFEPEATLRGKVKGERRAAQPGGAGNTSRNSTKAQVSSNSSSSSSGGGGGGGGHSKGEVGGGAGAGSATASSNSSSGGGFSGEAGEDAYPPTTLSRVLSVVPCLWGYKVDTIRLKLDSLASMLDLPQEEVAALARRCPTLLICAPSSMAAKASVLQKLTGLPRKQIAAMVVAVPQLLFLSQSAMAVKFRDLVELLGVGEQEVAQMVSSRPMLLTSAMDTLRANWEELSGVASRR